MSFFVHVDNKKKDILILVKDPTQELDGSTSTAEKVSSINFTATKRKFCLSPHYNGANIYFFVNGIEIIKFKSKDFEIVAYPLCLGNISKDFSADYMNKFGLTGSICDFSVEYDAIPVDDILDIISI